MSQQLRNTLEYLQLYFACLCSKLSFLHSKVNWNAIIFYVLYHKSRWAPYCDFSFLDGIDGSNHPETCTIRQWHDFPFGSEHIIPIRKRSLLLNYSVAPKPWACGMRWFLLAQLLILGIFPLELLMQEIPCSVFSCFCLLFCAAFPPA